MSEQSEAKWQLVELATDARLVVLDIVGEEESTGNDSTDTD